MSVIDKSKEEKLKKLKHLVAAHKREVKKKGSKTLIDFGSNISFRDFLPTEILEIDELTGGGIPRGQFTVIAGPEKCGKSTLCAFLVAATQRKGGLCCWVDAEHQLDLKWLEKHGVNIEELLVINDMFFEPTLDKVTKYLKEVTDDGAHLLDLIIVDSITALASLQEAQDSKGERSLEDNTIAVQARKLSQFFRISTGIVDNAKTAVVLIGQVRCDIMSFGNLETIPGGKALEHYASLRLKIRRGKKSEAPGKGEKGFSCVLKLDKTRNSKTLPEGTEIKIPFYFDLGFSSLNNTECTNSEGLEEVPNELKKVDW